MTLELLERPQSLSQIENPPHECATCLNKSRIYQSSPDGRQIAAVWRCGVLSQKTATEVLVQPHEDCFTHRSLTDYWEQAQESLVR